MQKVFGLEKHCDRCLKTERWRNGVVLMVVDAALTSISLNYFTARKFIKNGKISNLKDLTRADVNELRKVWKNIRSWIIAKEIASYLSTISGDDREALGTWTRNFSLKKWKGDPIGRIKGVGLTTFQYLRIIRDIDTVMPDKIVKKW